MELSKDHFLQSLKNPYIKTCIELHIKDYVNAYNLDADKLEKEYLVHLGKGNTKRKKLIEENQVKIDDPSLTEYDKQFFRYVNQMLTMLVDPSDNKLALAILALYFNQKDHIHETLIDAFYYNPLVKIALDDLVETFQYFAFTHFSKDKIINSLIIVLYTLLVECEKCDKQQAIKFIEDVINSEFEKSDIPSRIRADYIEKYPIYCTGIYNGLPIFQFYTGQNKSFYNEEHVKQVQSFLNYFISKKDLIPTLAQTNNINNSFEKSEELANNEQMIFQLLNDFYKHYAVHPNSYKQFLIEQIKKNPFAIIKGIGKRPIFAIKCLISFLLTKLTKPLTKLTTRNSSQKPS